MEYTLKICKLTEENEKLSKVTSQLFELDECKSKIDILEQQLKEAIQVNQYITGYYQQ